MFDVLSDTTISGMQHVIQRITHLQNEGITRDGEDKTVHLGSFIVSKSKVCSVTDDDLAIIKDMLRGMISIMLPMGYPMIVHREKQIIVSLFVLARS